MVRLNLCRENIILASKSNQNPDADANAKLYYLLGLRRTAFRDNGRFGHVIIRVKGVHVILLGVEVVEDGVEDQTAEEGGTGKTHEHPHDSGVEGSRGQGFGDGGAECVCEEVHGLYEGFHARGGLGISVFETGDGRENLRDTDEDVGRGLNGNVDVVAVGGAINLGGIAEGLSITGSGGVDQVLHDRGIHHGQGGDNETKCDTSDWPEGDLQAAHDRVHAGFKKGNEDNDRDRVKVLHQVVGNAVGTHLTGLGDEIARELAVDDPVDGIEGEDATSDQGAL